MSRSFGRGGRRTETCTPALSGVLQDPWTFFTICNQHPKREIALPRIASPIDSSDPLDEFVAESIADTGLVRSILVDAARRREAVSYSDLLFRLGHRFTRPKMRAVCRTLDAIDAAALEAGEPALAVLVVRESDGLPGQGWWVEGPPRREGYQGPWSGPEAAAFVAMLQERAFSHWGDPAPNRRPRSARTGRPTA